MKQVKRSESYARFTSWTDVPMMAVSVLWLPVLLLPMVMSLSSGMQETFSVVDYTVWALFTLEYIIKLYLADDRRAFVHHNLLDLVVILVPFLRPFRALRLLRLLRLVRVGVVVAEILRRARSILTHKGLHFILLAVLMIVLVGAAIEVAAENQATGSNIHTYGQALWWAIVTITTVGYGDHFPVTALGQGVAVILMLAGIGLVGVLTATVASYFVEEKQNLLEDRLARMELMLAKIAAGQSETSVE